MRAVRDFLLFLTALCLPTTVAISQQPGPLANSAPAVIAQSAIDISHHDDLDRVVASIGDARVVMIGEPWHGDGGAIALRGALIERLHRSGFDVLAFEADFFATHRVWQDVARGADARTAFADAIFPFWAGAPVAEPLWRYVEQAARSRRPLRIAGLDTQITGQRSLDSLAPEMGAAIRALGDVAPADVARAMASIPLLQPRHPSKLQPADRDHLAALLRRVAKQNRDGFVRQTAKTLLQTLIDGRRDPGMAANLVWLAEQQYPGSRIIVVAHNNHILTDADMFRRSPDPLAQESIRQLSAKDLANITYLGSAARAHFGKDLVSIATLSHQGRYSTEMDAALTPGRAGHAVDLSKSAVLAPTPDGTVEAALARNAGDRQYVDSRRVPRIGPVRSRVLDYSVMPAQAFDLKQGYDGLLFVRTTYSLAGRVPRPTLPPARTPRH